MKKSLSILMLFFSCLFTGCEKDNEELKNQCESIQLINNDTGLRFDKLIILYEDSDYLIKAPVNLFVSDLNSYLFDYESYLSTVTKIVNDAKVSDTLNVDDYFPVTKKIL